MFCWCDWGDLTFKLFSNVKKLHSTIQQGAAQLLMINLNYILLLAFNQWNKNYFILILNDETKKKNSAVTQGSTHHLFAAPDYLSQCPNASPKACT